MIRVFFIAVLFLPFILLSSQLGTLTLPSGFKILEILFLSSLQSTMSAIGALLLGFCIARGLWTTHGKTRAAFEVMAILPLFLPTLHILVSVLNVSQWFGFYPSGIFAVSGFHVLVYSGFVGVAIARIAESRCGGLFELASVEGATPKSIMSQVLLPLLGRDMSRLGLLVFTSSLCSFSAPMIIGGASGKTLEVVIFESLSSSEGLSGALATAWLQLFIIFLLSLFLPSLVEPRRGQTNLQQMGSRWLLCLPLMVLAVCGLGWVKGLKQGFSQWLMYEERWLDFVLSLHSSLLLGVICGAMVLLLLAIAVYSFADLVLEKILKGYFAPSAALIGLSLLLIGSTSWFEQLIKVAYGLAILFLPVLYRWQMASQLEELRGQFRMAQLLGASRWQIFRYILWPQTSRGAFQLAGVAGFWAVGDFALSVMLFREDITAAQWIKSLISFYRIEMAAVALWPLIFVGILCYLFFLGAYYVSGARSEN